MAFFVDEMRRRRGHVPAFAPQSPTPSPAQRGAGKSEIKVFEALEGLRDLVGTSGRENQDSIAATLAINVKGKGAVHIESIDHCLRLGDGEIDVGTALVEGLWSNLQKLAVNGHILKRLERNETDSGRGDTELRK